MGYALLTGATGLLGSYLLHDGLTAGHRLAVLARPSRHQSAAQRIDATLASWEELTGRVLPRPVVIEGDLGVDGLGLNSGDVSWIEQHCRALIQNAASLTFNSTGRDQEPWLSNVDGTRRVLELCRRTGIREFHHVSTAYVCGLRSGRVLESELDVGQQFGNDYERSKVESEKMVREAEFLGPVTVYRPAIIVGDSKTGRTSTFHGFYAILRLAHTMAKRLVFGSTEGDAVLKSWGCPADDCKNFVPVDWVSAVMTHILGRPQYHGRTYHLVTQHPTPLWLIAKVVQAATRNLSTWADEQDAVRCDSDWFTRNMLSEIDMYRAYLRDDPQFDVSNTVAAAPQLPCPELSEEFLLLTSKYAISTNFGKARSRNDQARRRAAG